jgi:hypothetical protein
MKWLERTAQVCVGFRPRRDRMIVARQFIAWTAYKNSRVPQGRLIGGERQIEPNTSIVRDLPEVLQPCGSQRLFYQIGCFRNSVDSGNHFLVMTCIIAVSRVFEHLIK